MCFYYSVLYCVTLCTFCYSACCFGVINNDDDVDNFFVTCCFEDTKVCLIMFLKVLKVGGKANEMLTLILCTIQVIIAAYCT